MRLRLKEGWVERSNKRFGKDGGHLLSDFVTRSHDGLYVTWPNGGPDSAESFATLEEAHAHLLSVGSESPFHDLDELTAAAEGEGPEAPRLVGIDHGHGDDTVVAFAYAIASKPPAPRLCAVDRLEAAGYALQVNGEDRRIDATRPGSLTVFAANVLNTGRWTAWIDGGPKTVCVYAIGDESPGLNAALESLLSKPVGAVTVAQILGVA